MAVLAGRRFLGVSVAIYEVETAFTHPADIVAQRFSVARKGYDPDEVQGFLRALAEQVSRLQGEVEWQRAHSEHLERRREAAQEAAYTRLSRDFMDVVRRADEAATRVRGDAEAQARAHVGSAHREAARLLAAAAEQAEMILTQARAEAERMRREAKVPTGFVRAPSAPLAVAEPSSKIESDTSAMPPVREPSRPPEDHAMDVELDVPLFDLFDDLG